MKNYLVSNRRWRYQWTIAKILRKLSFDLKKIPISCKDLEKIFGKKFSEMNIDYLCTNWLFIHKYDTFIVYVSSILLRIFVMDLLVELIFVAK